MEKEKLRSNIQKVFWLNAFFSFMVLMPVIVPFFESRGLDMKQIYELQAIFAFIVLVLEVPSGYVSDLLGRRKTLMTACGFHSLGFATMALSQNFNHMILAEVFLALAISLFSGTDLSLLYDSIEALGEKMAPIKMVGRNVFFRQGGESVAGLLGGWLVLFHFEAPAVAQAFVGFIPLGIAYTLYEPPRITMKGRKHRENFSYIFTSLFRNSKILNLILINGIFYSFVTLVAVWSFQKYWQSLDISLFWFGYLWFAINICVGLVGRQAHKVEKRLGTEITLILIGLLPIIGFFGMSWTAGVLGIAFCFSFQVCRGLNSVIFADALNKRVKGDMRATANSIMGLGTRILMIGIGPLVGSQIDARGLEVTYEGLGLLYVGVFVFLLFPLLRLRKQFAPIPG